MAYWTPEVKWPKQPPQQIGYILSKQEGFTGRKWLFDIILKWLRDLENGVQQFMLIVGPAGYGKSAVIATMLQHEYFKEHILAFHFCQFNNGDTCKLSDLIQYLTFQIAEHIPSYKEELSKKYSIALQRLNSYTDPKDAFVHGVLRFLPQTYDKPMLILIDALDETLHFVQSESYSFHQFFRDIETEIPKWLGFLLTTRPNGDIQKAYEDRNTVELLYLDQHNVSDVHAFMRERGVEPNPGLSSIIGGSFQVAKFFVEEIANEDWSPSELKEMTGEIARNPGNFLKDPNNQLFSLYRIRFQRGLNVNEATYRNIVRVLESLVFLNVSLRTDTIMCVANLTKEEFSVAMAKLSGFILVENNLVRPAHKTFYDWLRGENPGVKYLRTKRECFKEYTDMPSKLVAQFLSRNLIRVLRIVKWNKWGAITPSDIANRLKFLGWDAPRELDQWKRWSELTLEDIINNAQYLGNGGVREIRSAGFSRLKYLKPQQACDMLKHLGDFGIQELTRGGFKDWNKIEAKEIVKQLKYIKGIGVTQLKRAGYILLKDITDEDLRDNLRYMSSGGMNTLAIYQPDWAKVYSDITPIIKALVRTKKKSEEQTYWSLIARHGDLIDWSVVDEREIILLGEKGHQNLKNLNTHGGEVVQNILKKNKL